MEQSDRSTKSYLHFFRKFFEVLGIFSVSYDEDKDVYSFSIPKSIYTLLLACLVSYGLYYQTATYINIQSEGSLLNGLLYLYPMVSQSLITVSILLSSIMISRNFVSLINSPENASVLASFLGLVLPSDYKYELLMSLALFVLPYFLDMFLYLTSSTSVFESYQLLSYVFVVYNFMCLNQNTLILLTVKLLYGALNEKLTELCEGGEKCFVNGRKKWNNVIPKQDNLESSWRKFSQDLVSCNNYELPGKTEELYDLRGQHHHLYRLCHRVNHMLSFVSLILVTHHCVLGVIYSYWSLRQTLAKTTSTDWAEILMFSRGAVLCFLSIIWLIRPATAISEEVERTSQIIQKMKIVAKHEEFKSEVVTFSLQLLIEKVSFSPYGFFELNRGLLLAMGGVVVSYLVILLQYQIMLDEQAAAQAAQATV